MIKSWRHKGLKKFFETGSKAGIQPKHAENLSILLLQISSAIKAEDINTPGNDFHKLSGDLKEFFSVKVSKNWRLVFRFEDKHVYDLDYIDYH